MVQVIGTKYPTNMPSLNENADIQTALKVYHYGQQSEPATTNPNSIAGHLENLENTKVDVVPTQIIAGTSNNLNLKTTTGYYSVPTNDLASGGSNYPPSATAGMLHVINDGSGIVYQTYISNTPKMYWRGYNGVWTSWKEASDTNHTHAEFTTLAGQIATKQANISSSSAVYPSITAAFDSNKVVVTNSNGQFAASSTITSTELGNLNGTTGIVPSLAGTVGGDGTSKRIFIQSTDPSLAPGFVGQAGDLWFW